MGGENGTTSTWSAARPVPDGGPGHQVARLPGEQVGDILDVIATGFRSDRVTASIGGTGTYGVSDMNVTSYLGNSVVTRGFRLSHLTGPNVDLSPTPRDFVNIDAASTVPVDLTLSKGDDNVTIDADGTADDLGQAYTVHGNGGNDTLTFRKSQATFIYWT